MYIWFDRMRGELKGRKDLAFGVTLGGLELVVVLIPDMELVSRKEERKGT